MWTQNNKGRKPKEGEGYERTKILKIRISESDLKYLKEITEDRKAWEPGLTMSDVLIKAIRELE